MIHVLCPNPAIDKLYRIDGFAPGEDYPGQRPRCVSGGKGVNVARVLAQLGGEVTLYAWLGDGASALEREMKALCPCVFLEVEGSCRTTVNILDRRSGLETVITEAGPTIQPGDVCRMMDALRAAVRPGDVVVCSGSIIDGAPKDLYAQVSRLCDAANARCVLDCNANTLPASLENARYALGKPNERELCAHLGQARTQQPGEIAALARRLMPPYGMLLVSMGGAGGVLAAEEDAYFCKAPRVGVVSTVGSGDACFAGAVYALTQGMNSQDTLRLAMACGAANAQREEPGVGSREEAFGLMRALCAERVG